MSDGGSPRDLVIYVLLLAGALVGGSALYQYGGQSFTRWFVEKKMPQIQAETEDQFQSNPISSNFDSSSF